MLCIPGIRPDDVCFAVALGVTFLSWFDLILLLCTKHTRIHCDWHKSESLEHGCCCTAAAAVLLLYSCTHAL